MEVESDSDNGSKKQNKSDMRRVKAEDGNLLPPYCKCGNGVMILRVTKHGENKGKKYYICPIGDAHRGHFIWHETYLKQQLNSEYEKCRENSTDDILEALDKSNRKEVINSNIEIKAPRGRNIDPWIAFAFYALGFSTACVIFMCVGIFFALKFMKGSMSD